MNIPIVIAAFNRAFCLNRLLESLSHAVFADDIKLIISIDYGGDSDVFDSAKNFVWCHGEKEIIQHSQNLGLRQHILFCGSLTRYYDGIILLEDDLYVSAFFYSYVQKVQSLYCTDNNIAGVALYSHKFNETACLPFAPMHDGFDVFFMQLACSWGQCWLSHQWDKFENWYELNINNDLLENEDIPPDVRLWPETSWKKYFVKYLIEKDKYFVYPRVSYSTNFGDAGVHHKGTNLYQVPLQYCNKNLILPAFNESSTKYDSYCEILPESLKNYNSDFENYNFDVDLYGLKKNIISDNQYVFTIRKCYKSIKLYSRALKPHEANIIENCFGKEISFAKKEHVLDYHDFLNHRLDILTDWTQLPINVGMLNEYIKLKWKIIESELPTNKVAVYGSLGYCNWLYGLTKSLSCLEPVAVIIDNMQEGTELWGKSSLPPEKLKETDVSAIILATECFQKEYTDQCRKYYGKTMKLINLYENISSGPYQKR